MSLFLPKRVKDLPPLEPDSDDDFKTPNKSEKGKENSGKSLILPMRISEWPALQSEDSDDEAKNDRLNYAILNDSFIVSPAKSIGDANGSPFKESNIHNIANNNLSIELNNQEICDDKNLNGKDVKDDELKGKDLKVSSILIKPAQVANQNISSEEKSGTPLVVKNESSGDAIIKPNLDTETPFKTSSDQDLFVTPQLKSVQMSFTRRPRNLTSSKSQKSRTAIENEFRTQKVLFQAAMSAPRQPLTSLPNDSINLSLGDSLLKTPTSPLLDKQPSPQKNDVQKSKKSSKELFGPEEVKPAKTDPKPTNPINNELEVLIKGKKYLIKKKIGSGGSSSVFLALCSEIPMECAIKIVDLKGDASIVEGYLNETKLLEKLQGNDSVVALYEYELLSKESKLFMVMEKGDSDLHNILQTYNSPLPLYVLMNFWYQMLQSVNYIHQNGVIHSDLKPANFLMVNGRLKLIDFGIASNISFDSTSIIKFSQAGTFNYISPEALIDTSTGNSPGKNQPKIKISTKSDVWSLGCILYLLLYQKTPFGNIKNIYAKMQAITDPNTIIKYEKLPVYYPQMLIEMANKCLQHNPKKRVSVAELLQYPFHMIIPITNLKI